GTETRGRVRVTTSSLQLPPSTPRDSIQRGLGGNATWRGVEQTRAATFNPAIDSPVRAESNLDWERTPRRFRVRRPRLKHVSSSCQAGQLVRLDRSRSLF